MIEGRFGSQGELFFEIELITEDGINLPEILLGSQWLKIFNLIAKYKEDVLMLE